MYAVGELRNLNSRLVENYKIDVGSNGKADLKKDRMFSGQC